MEENYVVGDFAGAFIIIADARHDVYLDVLVVGGSVGRTGVERRRFRRWVRSGWVLVLVVAFGCRFTVDDDGYSEFAVTAAAAAWDGMGCDDVVMMELHY